MIAEMSTGHHECRESAPAVLSRDRHGRRTIGVRLPGTARLVGVLLHHGTALAQCVTEHARATNVTAHQPGADTLAMAYRVALGLAAGLATAAFFVSVARSYFGARPVASAAARIHLADTSL